MESKDKANGKETWDCTMAAFRCRGQMTFLMYAAICTHSSGNFEHNLYSGCKLPLKLQIQISTSNFNFKPQLQTSTQNVNIKHLPQT